MKKLFTVIALLSAALTLKAGTVNPPGCQPGSLATWEAMTSCSFDDDYVLSNFSSSGDVAPSDIQVLNAGWGWGRLVFEANWTASGSEEFVSTISYDLQVTRGFLASVDLEFLVDSSPFSGPWTAALDETIGTNCTLEFYAAHFSSPPPPPPPYCSPVFGEFLPITDTLTINPNGGYVTVTDIEDMFYDSIAPESSEVWYFGIGLALLALGKRLQRA